ncbi:MAG: AraC family transcriptional regulator [Rhodothermales bacterium]
MGPLLEKVTPNANHSFAFKEDVLPHITIGWHRHPEYELTLLAESHGHRVVGDHMAAFAPGDLLLIGPNLPHYMRNAAAYYQGDASLRCRALVVHFATDFLGRDFFERPELSGIERLLHASRRGLHITGSTCDMVSDRLEVFGKQQGFERLASLLQILHVLAEARLHTPEDITQLASLGYLNTATSHHDPDRIDQVYAHLFHHYTQPLRLAEVASQVGLSASAFCKFFKRRTGKTFTQVLNEIRIGHACRLLIESDTSVTDVSYQSGYTYPSYFSRQFKAITGYAPIAYRRRVRSA